MGLRRCLQHTVDANKPINPRHVRALLRALDAHEAAPTVPRMFLVGAIIGASRKATATQLKEALLTLTNTELLHLQNALIRAVHG